MIHNHRILEVKRHTPPCPSCDELLDATEKIAQLREDGWRMPWPTVNNDTREDIICLTGSTRFLDAYDELFRAFSLQGKVVLTKRIGTSEANMQVTPEQKETLEAVARRHVELADCVYVLNVDGYIGVSTQRDIERAESYGKPVYYHETPSEKEAS